MPIFHSDLFPGRFPSLFQELSDIFAKHGIDYLPIPDTKDIWCRDYMPVRAADGNLVQFVYWPQYLRRKADLPLITPPTCYRDLPFAPRVRESVIFLDGGNLEISGETGIVTDRIYDDNPWYNQNELVERLRKVLALRTLIVIPEEPGDMTGHVDGMVRFIDETTVIMNDYSQSGIKSAAFGEEVRSILTKANLQVLTLPYAPVKTVRGAAVTPATGCYMNFLRVHDVVLFPLFQIEEDDNALACAREIFRGMGIEPIDASALAVEGGVINCISYESEG